MDNLLSTKQLQELLNIDRTTVYRMLKDGRLTGVKVGNQWRFPREEVDALLTGNLPAKGKVPANRPTLTIDVIPVNCIQSVQDVFSEVLNVGAVTVDQTGTPVTMISNSCRFCHLMLASESGQRACMASWQAMVQDNPGETFTTCHAGLQYARATIRVGGEAQATFAVGQFYRLSPDKGVEDERLQHLSAQHQLNLQDLRSAVQEVPVLNERVAANIIGWLRKEVQMLEEIGKERLKLIEDLQEIVSIDAQQIGQ